MAIEEDLAEREVLWQRLGKFRRLSRLSLIIQATSIVRSDWIDHWQASLARIEGKSFRLPAPVHVSRQVMRALLVRLALEDLQLSRHFAIVSLLLLEEVLE